MRAFARKAARVVVKAAAVSALVVVALVALALLCLDLAPTRRFVAGKVNALLASQFRGTLTLESIGHVGPFGARGVRARVRDEHGRSVLFADGLAAGFRTDRLLRSLIGGGPVDIEITSATADYVEVALDADESGSLPLAAAFLPRHPTPAVPEVTRPGEPPPRGVEVAIVDARLHHAWAHGHPVSGLPLDVELDDATATFHLTSRGMDLLVPRAAVSAREMPVGANPHGNLSGRAQLPSGMNAVPLFEGRFDGDIGGASTTATGRLEGDRLTGRVVASVLPGVERTLVPQLSFTAPLRFDAEVHGTLPELRSTATIRLGKGTMDTDATVSLGGPVTVAAVGHFAHLDVRDVIPESPPTDLTGDVDTALALVEGEPRGTFRIVTAKGSRVGPWLAPTVVALGHVQGSFVDAKTLVTDRGAELVATTRLRLAAARGPELDVDATLRIADLNASTFAVARGRGLVFIDGSLNLRESRLRAHVVGDLAGLLRDDLSVGHALVDARAEGAFGDPRLDAVVVASDLTAGKTAFASAVVHARGNARRLAVAAALVGTQDAPSATGTARVDLRRGVVLRDVSVSAERNGATVIAGAETVRLDPGDRRVEHAVLMGLGGTIHADFALSPRAVTVRAGAPRIDLRRVARALGLASGRYSGIVGADVAFTAGAGSATGHANVDLQDATFGRTDRGHGTLRTKIDGQRIDATLHGIWNGGRLEAKTTDLRLDGPPSDVHSWERATGGGDGQVELDLGRIKALLPDGALPFDELRGRAFVLASLSRKTPGEVPKAVLAVRTDGLRISKKGDALEASDGTAVRGPPPWRFSGVDLDLDADSSASEDHAEVRALFHDEHGTLAEVRAESPFPPPDLLSRPGALRAFAESSRLHASVWVPKRALGDFPAPLGRPGMLGDVELTLDALGTLRAPALAFAIDVTGFRPQRYARVPTLDAHVSARYEGTDGAIDIDASTQGRRVLVASVKGRVVLEDLLARRLSTWDLDARARLDGVPLEAIPTLADQRVHGDVGGTIALTAGSREDPHFHAALDAKGFSVGRCRDNTLSATLDVDARRLTTDARVQQPDGFAHVAAEVGVVWPFLGPPAVPGDAARQPARIEVQAQHFRVATIGPFVRDVVSGLDGRVDANVALAVSSASEDTTMNGSAQIADGSFELATIGEEFRAVRAKARFDPGGTIRVDDVYAEAPTGKVAGSAELRLRGLTLESAHGDFRIPKNDPLPLAVEGQTLADASGHVTLAATRAKSGAMDVNAQVLGAEVFLPEKSTRSLQPLEPAARVRIGTYRGARQFEVLSAPPIATTGKGPGAPDHIAVHIRDAEVRRGSDLRVRLDGDPLLTTGEDGGLSGQITLRDGFLEVQGKRFEVEKGTITFTGQADNPEVVLTAGWTAPEGTRVYADFVGPLKTGTVTLRSEPAHTKNEILSLILFGTTTGSSAPMAPGTTPAAEGAASAAGVGGGYAAQGLNKALDDLTGLDITARVDTSDSTNPRPELEVRIARDISVALAHVLGVPPPGTNPDRNFATLDFRFRRNWSVETTFGDQGSTMLDFIWQYRY